MPCNLLWSSKTSVEKSIDDTCAWIQSTSQQSQAMGGGIQWIFGPNQVREHMGETGEENPTST